MPCPAVAGRPSGLDTVALAGSRAHLPGISGPRGPRARRGSLVSRPALSGEVDAVDAVLRAALLGGVAVSVLRLAVRSAETPGRRPADVEADDEASRQDFMWSLTGFVSFIPFLNWTAWILPALEGTSPALFYGLAALYLLPLLHAGVGNFDSTAVFAVVLCALHVQVERLADTDPSALRLPGGSVQAAVLAMRDALGELGFRLRSFAKTSASAFNEEVDALRDEELLREERKSSLWQQRDFDRRLGERSRWRPGGAKARGGEQEGQQRGERQVERGGSDKSRMLPGAGTGRPRVRGKDGWLREERDREGVLDGREGERERRRERE